MKKHFLVLMMFLIPFCSRSQTGPELYNKFMTQFQQQDFKSAIETGNQYILKATVKDTVYLEFLRYLAFSYYNTGDYQSAVDKYSDARDLAASLLGKENYNYIMCTYNLAINNSYTGTYSRAFELMDEVIAYIIKDQTKNSQDYINTATQQAGVYVMAGCTEKAAEVYEEVFEVVKANYNENDTIYLQYINKIAPFYLQNGQYEKAEPFYVNAVKLMETTYGKLNENYIVTLNSLGEFYLYAGNYAAMEKVYIEFVDLCLKFYGKNSADYATSLNNLAVAYEKQGKNKEAEELYIQCLKIKEKVFKKESNFYALTLSNFAVLLDNMGKYSEAEKLLNEAIEIYKKVYGETNDNYAVALSNMASVYSSSGKYDRAIALLLKAEEIQKNIYGENYPAYVNTLNNLATLYEDAGKYNLAETTFLKAAELRKKIQGEMHTDYATTITGLAGVEIALGKFTEAEALLKRALEIHSKTVGEDHASYLSCLLSYAGLYSYMGNFSLSGEIYGLCAEKYLKQFGDMHPEYAIFLNNYGQFFYESGEYNKAEYYLKKALDIYSFALGKDNPDNVNMLVNLTNVMLQKGNYRQAEEYSLEAVRVTKQKLGENHPDYSTALIALGVFYYETGNYEKSEKYYLEAKEKLKTLYGEQGSEYITVLNNLGALYMARCIYSKDESQATLFALSAEKCFLQVLKTDSATIGLNHPDYSLHLNNLAEFYRNTGQFQKSEELHLKSIDNQIKVFGEKYILLAASYQNMGLLYTSEGEYDKAEEYCRKSLNIKQSVYGAENPICSDVMASLAYICECDGRYSEAGDLYNRALSMNYDILKRNFSFLSEEEKAAYLETISHYNHMYASFVFKSGINDAAGPLLNDMLINKGILLRSGEGMRNYILNGKDKALLSKYNEWLGMRQQLAKLYSLPEKDRYISVSQLEESANLLEKELVTSFNGIKSKADIFSISWKDIQNSLGPGDAAVEFGHFRRLEKDNTYSDNYFAVILKQGLLQPVAVELFSADEFVNKTGTNNGSSYKYVSALYSTEALYELVWKKIDPLLDGVTNVYCSPDGLLHKISLAAIKDSSGLYLSAKYKMNFMASALLIKERGDNKNLLAKADAALFGGAEFGGGQEGGWSYLDGTLKETENIAGILAGIGIPVKRFSGNDASEENLKALNGKNATAIIHIATHGYFYPAESETKNIVKEEPQLMADVSFRGGTAAIINFMNSTNPLMRSGLVFAGANRMWSQAPETGEDGVLTAYEMSNMNLSGTQLVVLSACETGLGDIKGSEGVYGLQRALKIAGVRFIIMSLWQVPDKETAEFMETFYTKLLLLKDIRKAFLETQSVMRKKYDPYYWGAFVLVE